MWVAQIGEELWQKHSLLGIAFQRGSSTGRLWRKAPNSFGDLLPHGKVALFSNKCKLWLLLISSKPVWQVRQFATCCVLCSGSTATKLPWCTSPEFLVLLSGNACSVKRLQILKKCIPKKANTLGRKKTKTIKSEYLARALLGCSKDSYCIACQRLCGHFFFFLEKLGQLWF